MTTKQVSAKNNPYRWQQIPYGRVFNNLTISGSREGCLEISQINGESLMETAAAAGAHVAIFDGKNQWYALHDSPFCRKHPGLGSRDLVAEMIESGRKRGIVYVPYLPVDCDLRAWEEHPDWRIMDAQGKPCQDAMPRVCENSPFRHYIADYLRDLAARYDIGGFWFDGLGVSTSCYCPWCRNGFRDRYGIEAPVSAEANPGDWRDWKAYKLELTESVLAEFMEAGRSVKPDLPINAAWVSGARGADQKWVEAFWLWPTAILQVMRGDTGAPAEFYIPASQYAPNYPISLTVQELRDRAMTSISCGCIPNFTLSAAPKALNIVNREIEERAKWLVDADPVPYVGVVFSENSRQLCEKEEFKDGPTFTLYGAVKALLEEKIPETCLSDYNLEHDDLSVHKVIILPDMGIVSPQVAGKLRAFVENGGGLVAGFRTSLCDHNGNVDSDFSLSDLLGVHYRGRMSDVTQLTPWALNPLTGIEEPKTTKAKLLRLGSHPIVDDEVIRDAKSVEVVPGFRRGFPSNYDLAYPGEMFKVEASPDTEVVAWEEFQGEGKRWPFITARQFGKGRVVYVAANLCFHYASHWTWPYVRRLITNSVRWAAAGNRPPFEVDSLLQVQATLFRQRGTGRHILHLLNAPDPQGYPPFTRQTWYGHFTSFGRQREDMAPITDLRVRIKGKFKKVTVVPGRNVLPAIERNGYTEVVVPRLDTHVMVVAE